MALCQKTKQGIIVRLWFISWVPLFKISFGQVQAHVTVFIVVHSYLLTLQKVNLGDVIMGQLYLRQNSTTMDNKLV